MGDEGAAVTDRGAAVDDDQAVLLLDDRHVADRRPAIIGGGSEQVDARGDFARLKDAELRLRRPGRGTSATDGQQEQDEIARHIYPPIGRIDPPEPAFRPPQRRRYEPPVRRSELHPRLASRRNHWWQIPAPSPKRWASSQKRSP